MQLFLLKYSVQLDNTVLQMFVGLVQLANLQQPLEIDLIVLIVHVVHTHLQTQVQLPARHVQQDIIL